MKDFKEWLSDYLIYFLIAFGVIGVIVLTLLGIQIYGKFHNSKEPTTMITETMSQTETESGISSEKASETEKETASKKTSETEDETETKKESEISTETSSETEKTTESGGNAQTESTAQTNAGTNGTGADEQTETPVSETQAVQTQAPETQAPETQASNQPVYMTVVSECYLRSTPEYGDNILTSLYSGTVVEFLDNDTGWAHVRVNGMTGYMGGRFLQ